jgi:hypothetical protein
MLARLGIEFRCEAIQPIQMPMPGPMTARMTEANTIRQVSISAGIFKGFIARTTARAAARAEDVYRGKPLRGRERIADPAKVT